MPLVRTNRAIIEILDSEGKITGHEVERFYNWEGEGAEHFTTKIQRDEATPEEVEELRGAANARLTAQCQEDNARIATLQNRITELEAQVETKTRLEERIQSAINLLTA